MKPSINLKTALVALSVIAFAGLMAFQFSSPQPTNYEPILMTRADMENAITLQNPRTVVAPGKMWVYNNYILLIEQYKGIHILDNTNPASTTNVGFIQVDGCTELAVKDGVIYANNAVDLIAIKSNATFDAIDVASRNRNALPMISSPEPWNDWYFTDNLPENKIIVRWVPYTK